MSSSDKNSSPTKSVPNCSNIRPNENYSSAMDNMILQCDNTLKRSYSTYDDCANQEKRRTTTMCECSKSYHDQINDGNMESFKLQLDQFQEMLITEQRRRRDETKKKYSSMNSPSNTRVVEELPLNPILEISAPELKKEDDIKKELFEEELNLHYSNSEEDNNVLGDGNNYSDYVLSLDTSQACLMQPRVTLTSLVPAEPFVYFPNMPHESQNQQTEPRVTLTSLKPAEPFVYFPNMPRESQNQQTGNGGTDQGSSNQAELCLSITQKSLSVTEVWYESNLQCSLDTSSSTNTENLIEQPHEQTEKEWVYGVESQKPSAMKPNESALKCQTYSTLSICENTIAPIETKSTIRDPPTSQVTNNSVIEKFSKLKVAKTNTSYRGIAKTRVQCDLCDRTFSRKDTLKLHKRSIHEGHPDYKCPVCGRICSRKEVMLKHYSVIHDRKPLKKNVRIVQKALKNRRKKP